MTLKLSATSVELNGKELWGWRRQLVLFGVLLPAGFLMGLGLFEFIRLIF